MGLEAWRQGSQLLKIKFLNRLRGCRLWLYRFVFAVDALISSFAWQNKFRSIPARSSITVSIRDILCSSQRWLASNYIPHWSAKLNDDDDDADDYDGDDGGQ